ncbi:MAG TPA: hypothetical protein PLF27_10330 [Sedimentibacter sp.]|nr:hypothetical protein [Sedimentibacter sp.]
MSKDIKPDDIKNTIKELQEIWNCVKINGKNIDYTSMTEHSDKILKIAEMALQSNIDTLIEEVSCVVITVASVNKKFRDDSIELFKKYQNNKKAIENIELLADL